MDRLERGTYIGGQQIAAVLGKHPHMSIGDVYLRSIFGDDQVDPNARPIRRGRIAEHGLITEVIREHGIDPDRVVRDYFAVDERVPFFAGTTDAVVLDADGRADTIIEVTTTNRFAGAELWGPTETEDAAPYKWIQSQWYMGLLGAKRTRLACWFSDNDDLRHYEIPRADDAIAEMRAIGSEFWLDYVLTKTPPDPRSFGLASETAPVEVSAIIDRLCRAAPDGREISIDDELLDARNAYVDARDAMDAWERVKAAAGLRIRDVMQDATRARGHGVLITWSQPRKGKSALDLDALLADLSKRYRIDPKVLGQMKALHTKPGRPGGRVLAVR